MAIRLYYIIIFHQTFSIGFTLYLFESHVQELQRSFAAIFVDIMAVVLVAVSVEVFQLTFIVSRLHHFSISISEMWGKGCVRLAYFQPNKLNCVHCNRAADI